MARRIEQLEGEISWFRRLREEEAREDQEGVQGKLGSGAAKSSAGGWLGWLSGSKSN